MNPEEELLSQISKLKLDHFPMEVTEEYCGAGCKLKSGVKDSDFESKQTTTEEGRYKTSSLRKGPGGEYKFQLSWMRFATVSKFHGATLVGIREFYDAGDGLKPGKKGISLTVDQWTRLKEQIGDIDKAIKECL